MSYVLFVNRPALAEQREFSPRHHLEQPSPIYIAAGDLPFVQDWEARLFEFGLIDRAWVQVLRDGEEPGLDDNGQLLVDALKWREHDRGQKVAAALGLDR